MIRISDNWRLYRNDACWVLEKLSRVKPTKKNPEGWERWTPSYHSTLAQAARKILVSEVPDLYEGQITLNKLEAKWIDLSEDLASRMEKVLGEPDVE